MSRKVLLLTNEWTGTSAAQELPEELPIEYITLFASTMRPPFGTIWQVVDIPDEITDRDTTRYAEQAAR